MWNFLSKFFKEFGFFHPCNDYSLGAIVFHHWSFDLNFENLWKSSLMDMLNKLVINGGSTNIWLLSHFAFGLQFSIVSPMHTIWKDKIFCPCALWSMITSCFSSDVLLASFFDNNSWKLGMKCKFITCQLQIITIDKNGLKFVMHSSHFYLTINSTYIEVKYIL